MSVTEKIVSMRGRSWEEFIVECEKIDRKFEQLEKQNAKLLDFSFTELNYSASCWTLTDALKRCKELEQELHEAIDYIEEHDCLEDFKEWKNR